MDAHELLTAAAAVEHERAALHVEADDGVRAFTAALRSALSLEPWRADAACHGKTDLFFSATPAARSAAILTCRRCPVLSECRTWAMGLDQRDDRYGVAGGMDPEERRDRRRAAEAA